MNNTTKLLPAFLSIFAFVCNVSVFAGEKNSFWKDVGAHSQVKTHVLARFSNASLKVRALEFDEVSFISSIKTLADTAAKSTNNNRMISLPLPDGSETLFEMTPSSVMSDSLAKQFPQINTWNIKGVSQNITGTIDFNHKGFHGMLSMPDGDRIFIEPDLGSVSFSDRQLSTQARYMSFSQRQNEDNFKSEFSCGTHDKKSPLNFQNKGSLLARPSSDLITYRLAVATTGEYSQFHGGTVAATMSAIATTINRVNQIFRRDFAIQFELVDEQADIIYLNSETDPYTNADANALVLENNRNLSMSGALSKTQYDIGHVFGAGNVGGLALVGGVCNDEEKAFGATGISSPIGLAFDLDFVAHELGHQVGGTHTFNSNCVASNQRTSITAVEPGSGTTIMAYPGICGANNIQSNVDPQFHVVSIDQISSLTRLGSGRSCGVRTAVTNQNPTINAGLDNVVPARTPIVFIAEGADTDNDDLTYSWEQTDTGTATNLNVDSGDNALFRSRPLTNESVRFIPRLDDLFSNMTSDGELLPVTNREINMAATVRDGKGGVEFDLVKYQIFDTGQQFRVTSQTNNQSFAREGTADIRWNVAGTNAPPISCANVDIGIATSDGQGFDITTTSNDGREEITIPSDAPLIENGRFIVSCNNRNFFNISSGKITLVDQLAGGSNMSSGGGGSFNLFVLLSALVFVLLRKSKREIIGTLNLHKKKWIIPFLFVFQACSTPEINETADSEFKSAQSTKFGDRFSVENIKKEREAYYSQKLTELRSKNVVDDATMAIRSNDIFLMSIASNRGTEVTIPGLVEPKAQMVNCSTKASEGFGDILYGKNHIRYRQELLKYMSEFNTLLFPYCK